MYETISKFGTHEPIQGMGISLHSGSIREIVCSRYDILKHVKRGETNCCMSPSEQVRHFCLFAERLSESPTEVQETAGPCQK